LTKKQRNKLEDKCWIDNKDLPTDFEIPDNLLTMFNDVENSEIDTLNSGEGLIEVLTELFFIRKNNDLEEFDFILDMRKEPDTRGCSEEDQKLGQEMLDEIYENAERRKNIIYMEDFLLRIPLWLDYQYGNGFKLLM